MSVSRLRLNHRQRVHDSAIGWVSTSDTLLFGLALFLVLAASLSAKLVAAIAEKGRLSTQNAALAEKSRLLQDSVNNLTALLTKYADQASGLKDEVQRLMADIAAKEAAAAKEIRDLRTKGSSLWRDFQKLKRDFLASQTGRQAAEKRVATLQDQVDAAQLLKQQHEKLQADFAVLQAKFEEAIEHSQDEKSIRGELISLKGKLNRVAILFDASESMKEGDRWNSAQKVIASWLEYLSMQECVLIVFSDNVHTFPADGSFVSLAGEDSHDRREELLEFLKQFAPLGRTNTLAALQKAYELNDLDTIVLFTDGSPYIGRTMDRIDTVMVDEIYQLCESKSDIPINAVGLGNYFSPELSAFLLKIAELTNGTFVGR